MHQRKRYDAGEAVVQCGRFMHKPKAFGRSRMSSIRPISRALYQSRFERYVLVFMRKSAKKGQILGVGIVTVCPGSITEQAHWADEGFHS